MTIPSSMLDTIRVCSRLKEVEELVRQEKVKGVFLVAYDPTENKMYTNVGIDSEFVDMKDLLALVKRAADDAWAKWRLESSN